MNLLNSLKVISRVKNEFKPIVSQTRPVSFISNDVRNDKWLIYWIIFHVGFYDYAELACTTLVFDSTCTLVIFWQGFNKCILVKASNPKSYLVRGYIKPKSLSHFLKILTSKIFCFLYNIQLWKQARVKKI
jgi:hypothetical protein